MAAEPVDSTVETPSIAKWKKAPTVRDLKQNFQDAQPIQESQAKRVREWLDNLRVEGAAKLKPNPGNSSIVPKLIRKQAEWRYASLSEPFLGTDDLFNVKPVTWEDRDAAKQNELLLNHQMSTAFDKVALIDEYVRTAVDEGTAILRVGWVFEEEEVEVERPLVEFVPNPQFQPTLEHIAKMQQESPSQFDTDVPDELKQALEMTMESGIPYEPRITGSEVVQEMKTIKNHPTVEVCDYRNVTIDPTCNGDIDKASFLVYSFETSKSELEKDGRYKNLDQILVNSNSILAEPDHGSSEGASNFNFNDEARKKFVVYEYWGFWDIHGTGVVQPIVCSWVGNTMIRQEENPFPDKKIPFVVVQYLPVRKSTHGEPDGALLEDNQKVSGAILRGVLDVMGKSANGQTGIRRDMLDTTNRRKFDKGQDYEFNQNVDPRQGVYMHTYPEIPASAQFMLQLQAMEAESLTGVKSFSQGISGSSLGDVASLGRGALDAASKRELGILRRLSQGIVKVGRKIIAMNAVFLSDEEVIRVTNEQFVTIRRDDLGGNFDLRLSISTAEEDATKVDRLSFLLQTTGPNMDPGLSKIILGDIARLHKMPDLAHRIETFQPEPDPVQQQIQQLELVKLQKEIALMDAQIMKHQAGAQLDMAKSGTEQVKQGNVQSDTDLKNLNYVEQETGVQQERAKELHGAQARAQGELKVLDHALTDRSTLLDSYIKNREARS